MTERGRHGFIYGLIAYGWWGLVPLYFKSVQAVPSLEMLAHRVVWSLVFLLGVLTLLGRWPSFLGCFRSFAILRTLLATSGLIAVNWYVYIYSVEQGQIVQASLGYFITPLVSVVLGMIFFREHLRPLQLVALFLAVTGTVYLTRQESTFPWISFTLAFSFSFYGLLRKSIAVDGLVGLSVETVVLVPFAVVYLLLLGSHGELAILNHSWSFALLIALSGVVTTVPLLCFGQAAQLLPLSTLGFLQYLSPSIQFALAITLFGEDLNRDRLISFCFIWVALALFTIDSWQVFRKARRITDRV